MKQLLPRSNSRVWYNIPFTVDSPICPIKCPTLVTADDLDFTVDSHCRVLSYDGAVYAFRSDSTYILADSVITVDGG